MPPALAAEVEATTLRPGRIRPSGEFPKVVDMLGLGESKTFKSSRSRAAVKDSAS